MENIQDKFESYAKGCILGAFIGDSIGSYNEFGLFELEEDKLHYVMKMPGGGPHKIGAGQVTDDSELAMCLMKGLINAESHLIKQDESNRAKLDMLKAKNKALFNMESIAE